MADTTIEWTDVVWNPTTGCDKVSAGCDNCYALTMAKRLKGMGSAKYQTDGDPRTSGPGFGLAMHEDVLTQPLKWHKPRRVFVNSMSDLFHPKVTDDFLAHMFAVMIAAPHHTFQVLTKRAPRMAALTGTEAFWSLVSGHLGRLWNTPPPAPLRTVPEWIWLGVSVENQEQADARLPHLARSPAVVRWVSAEPLLGPIDLTRIAASSRQQPDMVFDVLGQRYGVPGRWQAATTHGLDWVVIGGESGPGARPMHPDWARTLRDQCVTAGVPFLFKQWGGWAPNGWRAIGDVERISKGRERVVGDPIDDKGHREVVERTRSKHGGRELDGRTWDEYPAADVAASRLVTR